MRRALQEFYCSSVGELRRVFAFSRARARVMLRFFFLCALAAWHLASAAVVGIDFGSRFLKVCEIRRVINKFAQDEHEMALQALERKWRDFGNKTKL